MIEESFLQDILPISKRIVKLFGFWGDKVYPHLDPPKKNYYSLHDKNVMEKQITQSTYFVRGKLSGS